MKENIKEIFSVLKEWWKKIIIIIDSYLKEFKKNWVFFTLVLVLFSSATVCLHVGTAKTFSGREEFFHERIAAVARENEEKTVLMNIKPNEYDKEFLLNVSNNYNKQLSMSYFPFGDMNTLYYKIDKEYLSCNESENISLLFPNVFSSKEIIMDKNDVRYKMDDMELYYLQKPTYNFSDADYWCVVSSKFAKKIMNSRGINNIENVINEVIVVSLKKNSESYRMRLNINAIYDSNLGIAPKIEKIYGDVVLSWFFFSSKTTEYNDLSIDIELHHDENANRRTLNYFQQFYNLNNSKIKFHRGLDKDNYSELNDFFVELYSKSVNHFYTIYIAAGLYLFLTIFIIHKVILLRKNNKDLNNQILKILIFIILLSLGTIELILIRYNFQLIADFSCSAGIYTSIGSIYSLLMIPIIILIFIIKDILLKKEGEENVCETQTINSK